MIKGMHESGAKIADIAKRLNRHRNCILNYLKNPTKYGTALQSGRKSNIDIRCKRQIQRLAVVDSMSSGQIKDHMGLNSPNYT